MYTFIYHIYPKYEKYKHSGYWNITEKDTFGRFATGCDRLNVMGPLNWLRLLSLATFLQLSSVSESSKIQKDEMDPLHLPPNNSLYML